MNRQFYILGALVGTFIPWISFGRFFATEGGNIPLFIEQLFSTLPAAGFTSDILITVIIFWIWSFFDAREHQIKLWWLTIPAVLAVGMSLAMPLYFALRLSARAKSYKKQQEPIV